MSLDDPFVAHRSLLFTVAYELLGSATDAEDVVQETWLRWYGIGANDRWSVFTVRNPHKLGRVADETALSR